MMRVTALTMCLMLPMSAFAQDPVVTPAPEAAAAAPAAADVPAQASLVPTDAAPNGATEGTRSCGMARGCGGKRGAAKIIVITSVAATILTAVGVGIAVGVSRQGTNGQVPR